MYPLQIDQGGNQSSILRIYCLGGFRIIKPEEETVLGMNSKHKMWLLLKYLIVKKGVYTPTEDIVACFWPQQLEQEDTAALRTTLSRLKSILEPQKGINRSSVKNSLVIYRKEMCILNPTYPCWVDIFEFERLCALAHQRGKFSHREAITVYLNALDLYNGDFLAEDLNLEWAIAPREYYRRLFQDSVKELSKWLIEENDLLQARGLLEKALRIDAYDDKLWVLLLQTLYEMGDYKEAKNKYSYYSAVLYKELGVKPTEELKKIYRTIVNAEMRSNLNPARTK